MKSAKKILRSGLLIILSIIMLGCQSGDTNASPTSDEIADEQNQAQNEVRPLSMDQITNITWQWIELIENNPAAHSLVPNPENYTLIFWEDDTFSFKADCNLGNGKYTIDGDRIEFGPMMSTMAMCPPESLHDQYLALLGEINTMGVVDNKLVLTLKDDAGEMRFTNAGPAEKPEISSETPEPEVKTIFVGPEKVDCVGVGPMECLQVKEDPEGEWQLFYNQIEGFEWEPGYIYELRVAVYPVENPPADGSSLRYELLEEINKIETPAENQKPAQYISIEQPTNGTVLNTSEPIIVRGMGAGLFEGNVVVQILDVDGIELALQATILQSPDAGIGGEGPWETELNLTIDESTEGKIVAFSPSPKDGEGWIASDEINVTFSLESATQPNPENTTWQLTSLTDESLNSALTIFQVTAAFDPVQGQISGTAGCNRYFASYEQAGNQLNVPGPIGATRMMCPETQMGIENEYLAALEKVNSYEITSENNLKLLDSQGNSILIFQVDPYATTTTFTREELANTAYLNEFATTGSVQLVDGIYREPIAIDSATELVVMLTNFAAFGDLDGDGQDEAVVVLVSNPGGSGTFYDLAIVRKQGAAITNLDIFQLGDRVQIKNMLIENGEIIIEMLTQGPDDPICCPTQQVINVYTLESGKLLQKSSTIID